jgi:holin-like protein
MFIGMKNTAKIVIQIALLYCFFSVGEWIRSFFQLAVPGSIIGLLLLFSALILKVVPLKWIDRGGGLLQAYLPLLFVPASIGVINYFELFAGSGALLAVIVMVSTFIVLFTAGWSSEWLGKLVYKKREKHTTCQTYSSES